MDSQVFDIISHELKILYLDDTKEDRENFEIKVERHNRSESEDDDISIQITTVETSDGVIELLKAKHSFKVLLCDHNLPESRNGLSLIKYLKTEDFIPDDLIYALYTPAAGKSIGNLKNECRENDILFLDKTEEFSTTIEKICRAFTNSTILPGNPKDILYLNLSKDILDDLRNILKKDSTFAKVIGNKMYSASELITHVENRTVLGEQYVINYSEGLKFFKKGKKS